MKRFMANWLAIAVCVILCVGCSSVQPAQKQPVAAVAPPVQRQLCSTHHGIMKKFVDGWLKGNAPPPDMSEKDNTGVAACLGDAYYA